MSTGLSHLGGHVVTCVVVALLVLFLPQAADAKDEFDGDPGCNCFRAQSLPNCKSYFITETGLRFNLKRDNTHDEGSLVTDIGWMRNLDSDQAVGLTLYQAIDGDSYRVGIRPRYRRWLNENTALDFSAGLLVYISNEGLFEWRDRPDVETSSSGLVTTMSLTIFDVVGVTFQYERFTVSRPTIYYLPEAGISVPQDNDRDDFYMGVTLGSYPGVPIAAGSIVIMIAAIISGDN